MFLVAAIGKTPRYTLLGDENLPIGPVCSPVAGGSCSAIYGFTDRDAYDRFRGVCQEPWRPYPLVRRHLERLVREPGLQLVVVDALSSREIGLSAATAEAVLKAHVDCAKELAVGYLLSRDRDESCYIVRRAPQPEFQSPSACLTAPTVPTAELR